MLRLALPLLVTVALYAGTGAAQTMYKWTDAQGKVQYSDQLPKNFKGEITRIEVDAPPSPPPLPVVKPAAPKSEIAPSAEKPAGDPATKRRAVREKLAADLLLARERLETARKARTEGEDVSVDERQVVQQRYAKGTQPGTPRSNCREVVGVDGKKAMMCPALVPGEAYYERMRLLDEAVARAEVEVEEAQRAYRRGVD